MTQENSMNIWSKKGHKIKVTKLSINNGYTHDSQKAKKYLTVGRIYTVENIDVYDFHSSVEIRELPGIWFNSVNFIDA